MNLFNPRKIEHKKYKYEHPFTGVNFFAVSLVPSGSGNHNPTMIGW